MKRKAPVSFEKTGRARTKSNKESSKMNNQSKWPEYFNSALNTVLAFVSTRNHLATTFPVIRTSVERLLKRPLLLSDVAELKALMPDMITFSYVPRNEIQIHENSNTTPQKGVGAVDFSLPVSGQPEEEEHVLVLEFMGNPKGKRSANIGFPYTTPQALSPSAMKKLIESRNKAFEKAVDDLVLTISGEDAVTLVKQYGRDQVPLNPRAKSPIEGPEPPILDSEARPSVTSVIEELVSQEWYKDQIVHRRSTERRSGKTVQVTPLLHEAVMEALKSRNISELYSHQVASIQSINRGKNVVVSTSTASGKSVIYQVPLLCSLLDDLASRAVFVYPTKALAQDQQTSLRQLLSCCPGLEKVQVSTYDGDTPQEARAVVRDNSSVILTNFDMLHASILPHEETWRSFFKNMKLFVIDELHYYSGLMGSHVAHIIRRFRRLCAAVGS
ncbi:hypothetical protein AX15_002944 [Amanita polypyramis BW_CC]|nr:hypothetical protein AX15_002944 [Amanita polypyramis BW_CC]